MDSCHHDARTQLQRFLSPLLVGERVEDVFEQVFA
jgi:hypothetical protein